ncbi:MAG: dTMP kinase [Pyrinomonadaceae bacterium]|nr:dTMP kinase [Pyrinomonadaceae bacterium]
MRINTEKGKFIVFEGLDGSGQTTQANLLTKWIMEKRGQFAYYTKEPTDGPLGLMLRLFLSKRLYCAPNNGNATPRRPDETTMALCFAADRADHLHNEILPKLKDTVHVIADRYYHSSLAYQSVDAELPWIREINRNIVRPDLTLFLDVPPAICMKRMQSQRWHVELYEDLDNLEKVRKNFLLTLDKSKAEGERIEIISGHQSSKDVHRDVVQAVKSYFRTVLISERHTQAKEHPEKGQLELLNETEPLSEPEIAALQI